MSKLQITKERLKAWDACASGFRWFLEKFPQGAEFSDVYAALQGEKRFDDATWLTDRVFGELGAAEQVQQVVLISGADSRKIKALAAEGGDECAATTGDWANAATTGEGANAATTGYRANAATTGDWANAATTGNWANAATTGYRANAATTGNWANVATTGYRANAATTGYWANAATTGNWANAATTGEGANAATTGEGANAATTGEHSISAALGVRCKAKACQGGAIVLAHRDDSGKLLGVRASMVGDNGIKPDTWYELDAAGQFVEAEDAS